MFKTAEMFSTKKKTAEAEEWKKYVWKGKYTAFEALKRSYKIHE